MVVVLQRKLDTGDNQDRAVSLEKGTRVLFAYGFGNSPAYHGGNRGVAKINFGKNVKQVQIPSDADSFFDVVAPDVVLPDGVSDSYLQYAMDLGDNFPDIVGADFNVVSPSPHFVHHIILYDCGTSDKKDWLRNFGKVEVVEASVPISTCVPMFGWALGGDDTLVVPRDAALKGIRYVVLEAHFNQPVMGYNKATGEPDHAGAGTTDASQWFSLVYHFQTKKAESREYANQGNGTNRQSNTRRSRSCSLRINLLWRMYQTESTTVARLQ